MRTFKLKTPITYDEFMKYWSLTKLPKVVNLILQDGNKKNNSIPKYIAFDKNGIMFGGGGKSKKKARKEALHGLNRDYFFSHMVNGKGDDEKCEYIKKLYNELA